MIVLKNNEIIDTGIDDLKELTPERVVRLYDSYSEVKNTLSKGKASFDLSEDDKNTILAMDMNLLLLGTYHKEVLWNQCK